MTESLVSLKLILVVEVVDSYYWRSNYWTPRHLTGKVVVIFIDFKFVHRAREVLNIFPLQTLGAIDRKISWLRRYKDKAPKIESVIVVVATAVVDDDNTLLHC